MRLPASSAPPAARPPAATAGAPARPRLTGDRGGPDAVYLRSLVRAQLRLAIVLAITFALVLAGAAMAIAGLPVLHETRLAGVPLAWLLQAYGLYPLIAGFAIIAVRAARRNESRFRALDEAP